MKYIKKYWFIIALVIISIIRFLWSFNLPNFYLSNLSYDDKLMIRGLNFLSAGNYFGPYYKTTLIKGPLFPILLFLINLYKINSSSIFTLLYISASLFLVLSLKDIIKDKRYLVFIYLMLLFNPVTYSQDLFQRLYRNSISITEFIFFFGCVIRVLFYEKNKIINYSLFGISLVFMFLTREDNLWTYPVLAFIFIYTIFKNKNYKTVLLNIIPFAILIASLNIVSYINYKHYGIYTYNEIQKSEFHNTYKKILQIKDDKKIEKVAIPKSTLYLLAEKTESFKLPKEQIDKYYKKLADKNGEINNGNIIWYLRDMIYSYNKFKSGKESEKYYKKLGQEIDKLFNNGTLKKEFIMPSIYMSVPTAKELRQIPGNLLYAIGYTTTYQDIKTMTKTKKYLYNNKVKAYYLDYIDYHNTINITKSNPIKYEIIRLFYKYFTIIFSIIALIIYFMNILKFDKVSIISHLLIVMYGLIIGGVTYTHTTSFHAIRPLYLGNIYLIQSIFILINISRIDPNKQFKILKSKKQEK